MSRIIPIILSGGAGSRLWPVSRRMHPKPFMEVAGKPLLAHALERAAFIADEALIVTNQDHYYLTENLFKETPRAPKVSYLLEPSGRNTAPAIALAVRHVQKTYGDDAVCLVLAADHLISDDAAFEKAVGQAADEAQAGNLVVFGIRPTAPETGYGYLEVAAAGDGPQALESFVDTPDALLVVDRAKSQEVKLVVKALKASADVALTELPATVHRPWGTYATLKTEDGYQVKRITVAPGQRLSLQYHHKRAEHWLVTQGKAIIQVGDEESKTGPGDYRYIPLGEKHRLTNIGDTELVLVEVQVGHYLGEDDIVRLEDVYGRT